MRNIPRGTNVSFEMAAEIEPRRFKGALRGIRKIAWQGDGH